MPAEHAYVENGGPERTLSLHLPTGARAPLVIFVHGGAWISGDKSEHAAMADRFANDGLAVALVNYRLSTDPTVKNPSHAQDVAAAYDWLARNAVTHGYSATSIFLMGHSAGAHNAGMIATGTFLAAAGVPAESFPKGFIGLEGIYDIPNLVEVWPGYRDWFIEKAFGSDENWPAGSPTRRRVHIGAPWLVIHSTEDELVDVAQSRDFAEHMALQNVAATLNDNARGKHDEVILTLGDVTNPLAKEIESFIERHS